VIDFWECFIYNEYTTKLLGDRRRDMNNDKFIRGQRAKCNFYDDDFIVPQEIVDKVCEPFIVVGDKNIKYILPQSEKTIKIVTNDWKVTSDNDRNIVLSCSLNAEEKRALLNAINNREIYLEDIQ
jgi:hypothetical protein